MMHVEFNTNVKLLMGGKFHGNSLWNKPASSIDNCFKLYHVQSGKAIVTSHDTSITLESGHIYFINGYQLVSQECRDHFDVIWLHFLPKSLFFNFALKQTPLATSLPQQDFTSFKKCFELIATLFGSEMNDDAGKLAMLEVQALVNFVIAKVFRQHHTLLEGNKAQLQRMLPSLDYISENYTKNISLAVLAETCCLSPNYFHRLFTEIFEVSPLTYIRDLRMDEAVRQLVYSAKSIKEIAYHVGYEDEAYFSRVFSKVYHTSPGAYRKQFKQHIP